MSGRPEVLFPLFGSIENLQGVGQKTAASFAQMKISAPVDLLFTLPQGLIDRRQRDSIRGADFPSVLTVEVAIIRHQAARTRGGAYRVLVSDGKTEFQLVFFHGRSRYLESHLPEGSKRVVSGKVEMFDGLAQMVHPDHMVPVAEAIDIPDFEPVYPLTQGITQRTICKAAQNALKLAVPLVEWGDPALLQQKKWPAWHEALHSVHTPRHPDAVLATDPARARLAYDELFAHQLTLAIARSVERNIPGRSSCASGKLQSETLKSLPYRPTSAQARAIEEITQDMGSHRRMNRLLQGDVGAGKTLVAFMALLVAVEAGGQGVLMAPTEILARQHLEGLLPLAKDAGVVIVLLTGRDKGKERRAKLEALSRGDIDILLGTHAVFQQDVVFSDLRLVVVDEQHRFGVRQRMELAEKGNKADVLVMTATPIPRSLALAQYGDMDVSILDEKPPGRKPIRTAIVSTERMDEVVGHLQKAIAAGRQCYWVCPLVGESEVSDLTAAEERFKHLRAVLGADAVGLVHGQMPPSDKDAAMQMFQAGETSVLVATTVIEVGVNVPKASIMVIERAEFFGLAQLHQLRGRVGRGDAASTCLLMYQSPLSEGGKKRLEVLRETEDGFLISETDLQMRGAGDVIGTAQSGLPRFKVADLERQADLMAVAQADARALLQRDPALESPRGRAARVLLWLLRRDEAIRLISVG